MTIARKPSRQAIAGGKKIILQIIYDINKL